MDRLANSTDRGLIIGLNKMRKQKKNYRKKGWHDFDFSNMLDFM